MEQTPAGPSPKVRTAFSWLVRMHDRIWADHGFSLRERIDACALVWRLIIQTHGGKK
jgi:hypothetical protein